MTDIEEELLCVMWNGATEERADNAPASEICVGQKESVDSLLRELLYTTRQVKSS